MRIATLDYHNPPTLSITDQKVPATLTMRSSTYAYAAGYHKAVDPVEQEEESCIHSTVSMPFSHLFYTNDTPLRAPRPLPLLKTITQAKVNSPSHQGIQNSTPTVELCHPIPLPVRSWVATRIRRKRFLRRLFPIKSCTFPQRTRIQPHTYVHVCIHPTDRLMNL